MALIDAKNVKPGDWVEVMGAEDNEYFCVQSVEHVKSAYTGKYIGVAFNFVGHDRMFLMYGDLIEIDG